MLRTSEVSAICLSLSCFLGGWASAQEVSVAYIGDQGVTPDSENVLQLIVDEGVDLLVIQGDLGYDEKAGAWIDMMERALPAEFPVLSVAGNHDRQEWGEYRAWLQRRVETSPGLTCEGDLGVKAHCRFGPMSIVQTAPGVQEVSPLGPDDDYAGYISERFESDPSRWRICSFHKNQRKMQTGSKGDEAGWEVYRACREAGAMVATGHEHAYSRTWLMTSFESQEVAHREDVLTFAQGRSMAFVSGLGGHSARDQQQGGDWWASIYTASQGAVAGALICRYFEVQARCEFKSIDGAVPDSFTLQSEVGEAAWNQTDQGAQQTDAGGESDSDNPPGPGQDGGGETGGDTGIDDGGDPGRAAGGNSAPSAEPESGSDSGPTPESESEQQPVSEQQPNSEQQSEPPSDQADSAASSDDSGPAESDRPQQIASGEGSPPSADTGDAVTASAQVGGSGGGGGLAWWLNVALASFVWIRLGWPAFSANRPAARARRSA